MIKGVVFDMDGLMFDTENLTYRLQREILMRDFDIEFTLEQYKQAIGVRTEDLISLFKSVCGEDFDNALFRVKCREAYVSYTDKYGVPIKDGLFELLDWLKDKGYKIALSTSTTRKSAERTLRISNTLGYFDALVCAEDVKNGKPHPEPFDAAAKALGIEPESCLALEDSINGIKSAYSAKMVTVMIPDLIEPTEETVKKSKYILKDLSEVIKVLEEEK